MQRFFLTCLGALVAACLVAVFPGYASAQRGGARGPTTYYVDSVGACDGHAPCIADIQSALTAASAGDTVHVFPGTYQEDVTLKSGVVLEGEGAAATTIRGTGRAPAVTAADVDSATKLEGFTITGGGCAECYGGGILNDNSSAVITNVTITGNSAIDGGGIYNRSSFANLSSVRITANTATTGSGGGIYIDASSAPTIKGTTISGNAAHDAGGGIFTASTAAKAPLISHATITENSASHGGGIFNAEGSFLTVSDARISDNSATAGGGGLFDAGTATVRNTMISGNSALGDGGGIFSDDASSPTIVGSIVAGNVSRGRGGGIFTRNSATATVANCTVVRNQASYGGGIFSDNAEPHIVSSIFAYNVGGGIHGPGTGDYNDLWGNAGYDYGGGALPGTNDISADPGFVDSATGNYRLKSTASCIDAGNSAAVPTSLTTDFYGNPRISDGDGDGSAVVDIGAAEALPPLSLSLVFPTSGAALQGPVTLEAKATGAQEVAFSIRQPAGEKGVPIGFDDLEATCDPVSGRWKLHFSTADLPDGQYILFATGTSNEGSTTTTGSVPFSVRNGATLTLIPKTPAGKTGGVVPVTFGVVVAPKIDPSRPFVSNQELEVRISRATAPTVPLQVSHYGSSATGYRISGDKYVVNFTADKAPAVYLVQVFKKDVKIGEFTFRTAK